MEITQSLPIVTDIFKKSVSIEKCPLHRKFSMSFVLLLCITIIQSSASSVKTTLGDRNCYFLSFTDNQMTQGLRYLNPEVGVKHVTIRVGLQTQISRAPLVSMFLFCLQICYPGSSGASRACQNHALNQSEHSFWVSSLGALVRRLLELLILQRTNSCLLSCWCQCLRKEDQIFVLWKMGYYCLVSPALPCYLYSLVTCHLLCERATASI